MPSPTKPTVVKLLTGTLRKSRLNPREPKPAGRLSDPPSWFNDAQRKHWKYVLQWAPPGLLTKIDEAVLVAYCVSMSQYEAATAIIERAGLIIRGANGGAVLNPAVRAQNAAFAAMMAAARELGFTPSSRTRISVSSESADDDPWLQLASESTPTAPERGW